MKLGLLQSEIDNHKTILSHRVDKYACLMGTRSIAAGVSGTCKKNK